MSIRTIRCNIFFTIPWLIKLQLHKEDPQACWETLGIDFNVDLVTQIDPGMQQYFSSLIQPSEAQWGGTHMVSTAPHL